MPNYDQEIYNVAIEEGFNPMVAKFIVAQARLESGHYTSPVFKCNLNMYGMKYVGQPLATRGTLAPNNEISKGCTPTGNDCNRVGVNCKDSDYYAKYKSPSDSAKDTIARLYKIKRNGIGFNELNNSKDTLEFATLLKKRGYYGFGSYGTSQGESEIGDYSYTISSILRRINVVDFVKKNKKSVIGVGFIVIAMIVYGVYVLKKEKVV